MAGDPVRLVTLDDTMVLFGEELGVVTELIEWQVLAASDSGADDVRFRVARSTAGAHGARSARESALRFSGVRDL